MVECLHIRRVSSSPSSGVPLGRLEDGFFLKDVLGEGTLDRSMTLP